MTNHFSLYIPIDSGLHRLNPITKLVLVMSVVAISFLAPGYWTASIIFIGVLVPLSVWGKIFSPFVRTITRILLPLAIILFIIHGLFNPAHSTILFQAWIFSVKQEGIAFAYLVVSRIASMLGASLLLLFTTTPNLLMSALTERGLPSALAYIVVSVLQIIPVMQARTQTIVDAQRSRGLETEGSLATRVQAIVPLVAPLVLGSLTDVEERAMVLESRAFRVKRRKTSLIEITDTPTQRVFRIGLIVVTILCIGARLWLS
jgi:energy-coupling factor transport system permease protein